MCLLKIVFACILMGVLAFPSLAAPADSCASAAPSPPEAEDTPHFFPPALQWAIGQVDAKVDDLLDGKDATDRWTAAVAAGAEPFWQSLGKPPDNDEIVASYVNGFGRWGWRADLELALIAYPLIIPTLQRPWAADAGGRIGQPEREFIHWAAISVAAHQVTRFGTDPKYLDRLYALFMWSGQAFPSDGPGRQRSVLERLIFLSDPSHNAAQDVSWNIRDFYFICHALDRDDLCQGITRVNYPERFGRLRAFLDEQRDLSASWVSSGAGTTWKCRLLKREAKQDELTLRLPERPLPESPKISIKWLRFNFFNLVGVQNGIVQGAKRFAARPFATTEPAERHAGKATSAPAADVSPAITPALRDATGRVDVHVDDLLHMKAAEGNEWADAIVAGSGAFWEAAAEPGNEAFLNSYVEAFGRHGWRADFDLTLMAPGLLLPSDRQPWVRRDGDDFTGPPDADFIHRVANAVARRQVARFEHDPGYLDRLYRLMAWSGQLLPSDSAHFQKLGLARLIYLSDPAHSTKRDYPWNVRDFYIICHAIGQDDLCRGTTEENYPERFKALLALDQPGNTFLVRSGKGATWVARHAKTEASEDESVLRLPDRPFAEGPAVPPMSLDFDTLAWPRVCAAIRGGARLLAAPPPTGG